MILHSCYLKFPPGQWGQTYNVVPELSRWPFKPLVWMEPLKPMLLFHEKCKWKAPHSESRLDEFYIHTGLINEADKIHNKKRKVWISRLFIWSDKRSLGGHTKDRPAEIKWLVWFTFTMANHQQSSSTEFMMKVLSTWNCFIVACS